MVEEQLRLFPETEVEKKLREHASAHQPLAGGPPGATCGGCVHLILHQWAGRHWKCEIHTVGSTVPGGYGGKRRKRDPACHRYEPSEDTTRRPDPDTAERL